MNNLNQCQFIGNLGKDPEAKSLPSGDPVSNFSIACGWKSGDKEGTEWINIVVFGKLAGICNQYLRKGSKIYVSGKMRTRKWQDQNGNDRYTTEIIAHNMEMLNKVEQSHPAPQAQQPTQQAPAQNNEFEDDLPF